MKWPKNQFNVLEKFKAGKKSSLIPHEGYPYNWQ